MSEIEKLLLSRDFPYLQPWFYNHPWALRCELGGGKSRSTFRRKAWARLREIYGILFPEPADAVIFNYWMYDRSWAGGPGEDDPDLTPESRDRLLKAALRAEAEKLRFLDAMQRRYRHAVIRDLPVYEDPGEERDVWRNRIVCYADERGFDDLALLRRQLTEEEDTGLDIGLVSFSNECVLSVYDDRGCDVVFADPAKLREFYPKLEPYFLAYDVEEMARRLRQTDPV